MRRTKRTVGIAVAFVATLVATSFAVAPSATARLNPTPRVATITLGTHNVLRGRADFHRFAGVIGWQEVNDRADRKKMRRQLGSGYRSYAPRSGPAKAVPISWRASRFKLIRAGFKKTHNGERRVTPNRYITWVVLEVRPTGKRFIFINTHFVSGAWSRHPERQARWRKHYRILYKRVAQFRRYQPRKPIFVVGDFNRRKAMPMPSPVKWVPVKMSSRVHIDQMYAPANRKHTRVERLRRWHSDHHAYKMSTRF